MSTYRAYDHAEQPDFVGSTLILPIVSLANVAQLAADLIIHSFQLQRVGSLTSRNHVPLVTPIDYVETAPQSARTGLSTAIEVYHSSEHNITLIQQRSPVIKSRKDDFVRDLTAFIVKGRFRGILILAGTDPGLHRDFDNRSPFRLLSLANLQLDKSQAGKAAPSLPPLPASGITRRVLQSLLDDSASDAASRTEALLMYVVEGDNRQDAYELAEAVASKLELSPPQEKWREPVSWRLGLYGRQVSGPNSDSAARELYG